MLSDRVRGGNWGGLYGVGRLISDRMTHSVCVDECVFVP